MSHDLIFSDVPTREQRKHQAREFDLLGSEDPAESNPAAARIVLALLAPDVSETVLQQQLDRRILRALASGRHASRLGFSLVLTNILKALFGEANLAQTRFPNLGFGEILQLLTKNTKASGGGSISGQEERDILFGRLFGLFAFIESGILFANITRWHLVLRLILDLSGKKPWMQPLCGHHILAALKQMNSQQALDTLNKLDEANVAKTPEGVAVWVFAQTRFPGLKVKYWQVPFDKTTIGDLVAILRESLKDSGLDDMEPSQQIKLAGWNPILHPAWSVILDYFVNAGQSGLEVFKRFWTRVVDDSLFSQRATDGQKFRGFLVFQKMLQGFVDLSDHIEVLFSKNFMSCLMNQVSRRERYLYRAATKTLTVIESTTSNHKQTLIPILKCLLGNNGVYHFDERTNTKTVHKLLKNVSESTGKTISKIIRKPIDTIAQVGKGEASALLRAHVRYLSEVGNMCSSPENVPFPEKTFSSVSLELSRLAYYQTTGIPADILTETVREMYRTSLASVLAKASGRIESCDSVCHVVSSLDIGSMVLSEELKTAVQQALSRMEKLRKHSKSDDTNKGLFGSIALLHAVAVLRVYNAEPDAMEDLELLSQHSGDWKEGKFANDNGDTSVALIEMLLSMVVQPSSLMRQVTQQVFGAFTPHISAAGLELLTGPLTSGENTKGEKELFSNGDDEMEVDEDEDEEGTDADEEDDSDIEIDSDVEFIDIKEADDESGKEEEEEDEDEDEDEDGPNSKGEFDRPEDLDNELEKILNSHRLDKDVDAASSESEGDMSDSEMFAIDEQLAATIKPRIQDPSNSSKKLKKKAKQSVLNFKNRILDLLDIYVRNERCNALSFSLLLPLLDCMRATSTKSLADRASKVISNYRKYQKKAISNFRKSQRQATNDSQEVQILEPDDMLDLLREIHKAAGQNDSHAYAKAASTASLIVVSALITADKTKMEDVVVIYAKTQASCYSQNTKLQSSFLDDWQDWYRNALQQARN
ncbi:hypothetical protein LB504_000926 [Fusarium proliferatum]|nr:hypothetical protein LB504_000926 [Fusarium proliferatum]